MSFGSGFCMACKKEFMLSEQHFNNHICPKCLKGEPKKERKEASNG